ncbi:hypothetical protein BV898_16041 [Hypsibius exemplaris]|uniref:Uncharacterized protein n=1 Tax=Hypsibius exemplaris TaxID=2072580 RepID=A0A9X6NL90_HYPEX|nr:hypothetical protein BV898_16041 [Hypsibius exemplaris]
MASGSLVGWMVFAMSLLLVFSTAPGTVEAQCTSAGMCASISSTSVKACLDRCISEKDIWSAACTRSKRCLCGPNCKDQA